jgi:hypothetical protein
MEMEKYKPTPEDFKKAEEMMKPEEAEMTKGREGLFENDEELKESVVLYSGQGEKISTKNIKEIETKIDEGYSIRGTAGDYERLKTLGINASKINYEAEVRKMKKLFELNTERDLLYLTDGIEHWTENVKNYWYNGSSYKSDASEIMNSGGLRAELMEKIGKGLYTIPHTDSKDLKGYQSMLESFLNKIGDTGYDLTTFKNIANEFNEKIAYPASYESSLSTPEKDITFRNINLKDKSKKAIHPLLEPFLDEINKLEAIGIKELPDWLAEQGIMAGYSADYLMIFDNYKKFFIDLKDEISKFNEFAAEKGIPGVSLDSLLSKKYMEKLEIIDSKIHRINK